MEQTLKQRFIPSFDSTRICVAIAMLMLITIGLQGIKNNYASQGIYRTFWNTSSFRVYSNAADNVLATKSKIPSDQLKQLQLRMKNIYLDCSLFFFGDKIKIRKALPFSHHKMSMTRGYHIAKQHRPHLSCEYYINITQDCNYFKLNRLYIEDSLTDEEKQFPIAFTIMMYADVERSERLLRSIYRPQNYYCIHIDENASDEIHVAMRSISSCFPNVFISSRSIKVKWGMFSVLEQDLICMEDLMNYSWRYLINLTGQEFPLKTNNELVAILKALNGSNNIAGSLHNTRLYRTEYHHKGWSQTNIRKSPPPGQVTLIQGSVHIVVQRGFVDFLLHNETAMTFREWLKDTIIPDETFFSTLNYNPQLGAPGAYKGKPEMDFIDVPHRGYPRNPFIARFKNWGKGEFDWPCHGIRLREICIFGIGDLPLLATRKELFANKFLPNFQPEAYDCMEELHFNKTVDQIIENQSVDVSFYEHLDFVKNHV